MSKSTRVLLPSRSILRAATEEGADAGRTRARRPSLSDQFFSEEQLEAYRALEFHIMKGLLTRKAPFTVKPDPWEPDDKKRVRIQIILSTVHAAAETLV
jgi:hypothetical protein